MSELSRRMFFVIGPPRSGTTLLMRMLNVHDDIYTRPEPHLLTPLAHLGYYGYVDKAPYDPFQASESVKQFVADLPAGERDYLDALRAYSDTMYGRMLGKSNKRYFLDKTPAYGLILPFLAKLYPDAVYVILTRHPFAVFSSYAKSFFDNDWDAAYRFNPVLERYVPAMASFLQKRPVERLYHVRYESLVADPHTELRNICALADLPYHDDLVEYQRKAVEGQGLGDPIGVGENERPTTASVNKWAREVVGMPERIALLERMVAQLSEADLATWGHDRASLWHALEGVDPEQAKSVQQKAKKWDRHHLERRLLLTLRRDIHHNALGRALQRVRFYCDVLLRE
jgi:hypothetical protein